MAVVDASPFRGQNRAELRARSQDDARALVILTAIRC